jgi:hypothetical protein
MSTLHHFPFAQIGDVEDSLGADLQISQHHDIDDAFLDERRQVLLGAQLWHAWRRGQFILRAGGLHRAGDAVRMRRVSLNRVRQPGDLVVPTDENDVLPEHMGEHLRAKYLVEHRPP